MGEDGDYVLGKVDDVVWGLRIFTGGLDCTYAPRSTYLTYVVRGAGTHKANVHVRSAAAAADITNA